MLLQCQFKEALEKIQEASKFDPEPKTQLAIYITLGRIYLVLSIENLEADASDNFKMAKENFERGLKLSKELRNIGQTFVCLTLLGQLHVLHKIFDESIEYLNAAVSSAATVGDNRLLCQIYAEHFLFKFFFQGEDKIVVILRRLKNGSKKLRTVLVKCGMNLNKILTKLHGAINQILFV